MDAKFLWIDVTKQTYFFFLSAAYNFVKYSFPFYNLQNCFIPAWLCHSFLPSSSTYIYGYSNKVHAEKLESCIYIYDYVVVVLCNCKKENFLSSWVVLLLSWMWNSSVYHKAFVSSQQHPFWIPFMHSISFSHLFIFFSEWF
jgi:hypothetical protein